MRERLEPIGTTDLEQRLTKLEEEFTKALNNKSSNLTIFLDKIQKLNELLDTLFSNKTFGKNPLQPIKALPNLKHTKETPNNVKKNVKELTTREPIGYQTSTRVKAAGYGQLTQKKT